MQTILGLFHPALETALVDEILACKAVDLLCPLLVLIPSDSLRRRLKLLLVGERRLSLLNVQLERFVGGSGSKSHEPDTSEAWVDS